MARKPQSSTLSDSELALRFLLVGGVKTSAGGGKKKGGRRKRHLPPLPGQFSLNPPECEQAERELEIIGSSVQRWAQLQTKCLAGICSIGRRAERQRLLLFLAPEALYLWFRNTLPSSRGCQADDATWFWVSGVGLLSVFMLLQAEQELMSLLTC